MRRKLIHAFGVAHWKRKALYIKVKCIIIELLSGRAAKGALTINNRAYKSVKRALDLFFAFLLCVLLSWLMLICWLLVKSSSPGPALFCQKRPGKGGKIFTIYKFRTMRVEAERGGKPLGDMERMTRAGRVLRKLSLDELPQFFNIIVGNMSFIGPRPLLVEYLPRYSAFQARRHEVRPGITGYAQVKGRNALTWEKKFDLDVYYVDHLSFALDMKIFFMTIAAVLARRGVDQSAGETMRAFMGEEP